MVAYRIEDLYGVIHPLTVDEYLRIADPNDPAWERTELVQGVVYDVTPQYARHAECVWSLAKALDEAFPADTILIDVSVRLGATSLVGPDVGVVRGDESYDPDAPLPASLLRMAVEVSTSTLAKDLGPKQSAYAEGGVPVYWVVDPTPETPYLVCHTDPTPRGYARMRRIELPDGVQGLDIADALHP